MFSSRPFIRRYATLTAGLVVLLLSLPAGAQEPAGDQEAAASAAQQPADVQALLQQGNESLEQQDYEKAVQIFSQLITVGPTQADAYAVMPQAYTGRGRAFTALGDFEAAQTDFSEVLTANDSFVPALVARGQMWLALGNPVDALTDFQKAATTERTNPEVLFGLGKSFVMLGDQYSPMAIRPLTMVIEADPQNVEAYRLRGTAFATTYKAEQAFADLNQAISLDPDDHQTYFTLAIVQRQQEQYAEAIKNLDLAIEHFKPQEGAEVPFFVDGYLVKAATNIDLGNSLEGDKAAQRAAYQASLDACDRALELLGDLPPTAAMRANLLHGRGIALRMLGELNKAVAAFSEALDLNPDLGETYFRRGICYHALGESQMAATDFSQAAIIAYDDPRPRLWLGLAEAQRENYYAAVAAFSQAIVINDRYTLAYVNRGLTYMMLGEYERAIDNFNDAIRVEPMQAGHYFKRGVAYEQLKDYQNAADSFAGAIERDDRLIAAYQHMATVLDALGRANLATEYRQKADELGGQRQNAM